MEIVENTLESELDAVLERPLFAFLAHAADGAPRVSPLWFLWEGGVVWHIAQLRGRSYPDRIRRNPRAAVAVVDFDPLAGRVEHVGMRGDATLEPYDRARAERLLEKYLGDERAAWPPRFTGMDADGYRLLRVKPETVVARDQSYPAPAVGD